MTSQPSQLLALNRGIMSALALARLDLKRTALAAETMTNWMPRVLGPMSLRPGLEYIGTTYGNAVARHLPFVYSASSTSLIELTNSLMRVRIADTLLTRAAVSTAVTNGTFDSNVTGWTDEDESGATSAWLTGGYLSLKGTGVLAAIRSQQVTVGVSDQNVEHGLRIVVARGPVTLRVGSTNGDDDYVTETVLRTGTHSIAFTPTGNFYIQLSSTRAYSCLVDSVAVEGAGVVTFATPWLEADLPKVRGTQSADVMFIACEGYQQRRIERRAARSWSLVNYETEDGPFRLINTSNLTITPSALSGDVTLTASESLFKSTHVGALFRLSSTGQIATVSANGADQFTDPILVNGVGGERRVGISISGTWAGTVTLQYSVGEPGAWVDQNSWTSNTTRGYTDDLDGQSIYYRLGIKAGEYTSGTAVCTITISSGTSEGTARITAVASGTSASAVVLESFGSLDATSDWYEGAWSTKRGWPSAVALYDGRLWWMGKGNIWGSESDAYEDFDPNTEGDAGAISKSIAEGAVDSINWALPLQRLMVGTASAEWAIRSTSFEEPLTPTNFAIRASSTQGSAQVQPERIDNTGVFTQRSGARVYLLGFDPQASDYALEDATQLVPDLNSMGITHIAVQRQPDTRVHCVRSDGKVAVLVFDKVENVLAWTLVETDGEVEDVAVLPGTGEDTVYYTVKRTVDGNTVRYLEKWAQETECRGGTFNGQADAFYRYSGAEATTIAGLDHLEGEAVIAWGDGADLGEYTVSGGEITLSQSVTSACIGLGYEARFKSMKLASAMPDGIVSLNSSKRIDHLGLILAYTHKAGLEFGPTFDTMDPLPDIEAWSETGDDYVWEQYDQDMIEFPGEWTTDARICLKATAPRPCTVLAVTAR